MAGYAAFGCTSSRGPNLKIDDYYDIGSRLTEESSGGSGEVVRGIRRSDGLAFAVKVVSMDEAREDRSQIDALTEVNHDALIKLVDWFETPDTLYVVMELAMGGELFGRIAQGAFSERDAAAAFRQILEGIGHMHSRGIVHCDLKPENILYADETDRQIKIADFGFAQFLPGGADGCERLYKETGTLSYVAPEVLKGIGYGTKADMWSLGVILYILLSGIHPFGRRRGETDDDVKRNIRGANFRFYPSHFANVSEEAKDLIKRLVVLDPALRLSWEQALEHEWMRGHAPDEDLGGEYLVQLGAFNDKRGMYKLASHALAGLVSRFAQPDAIAAISAHKSSLSRLLQEGSIQPLVSLAYSKVYADRKNACNALANLALKQQYQSKIIAEGALRRLNQLALKENQSSDIKFFIALALSRLAASPSLRASILDPSPASAASSSCSTSRPLSSSPSSSSSSRFSLYDGGPDSSASPSAPSTLQALLHLSHPPPFNPSRTSRKAVEALSLLALEDSLHHRLVAAGALPPLVRQAHDAEASCTLQHAALRGLRRVLAGALKHPRHHHAASVDAINAPLNALYYKAVEEAGKHDAEMGGVVSLLALLQEEGMMQDLIQQEGRQPWHQAATLVPHVAVGEVMENQEACEPIAAPP
eukprot:CAMPEP_0181309322 /NCGR_PEP_ID=MMETSP1101-20121128/11951_1 /TAXON_ID=46948 /ORGANISM="Rhodomonas abbreviata, Strain Caron Lab Isolate" /LENGTH=646 /DNA_ID=CAMNT_0023415797 /DNA_START=33 /DNA_END=1969 /DNA_ORIENTATION=+